MADLRGWGSKLWDQANMWDDGRTWKQATPVKKKPQQQQSRQNLDLRPQGSGNPFQNARPQVQNKPVSQQEDEHENLFESVVKGLVQSEATAAKGISRVLPGGMNDINAQAKAVDEANKFMKQTIADKRAGKINAEQANKLISLALDESNRSHKELTGTINDMPDRGDLAAGFAGTALDIATAGSYSRLKAGTSLVKPSLTTSKELAPMLTNKAAQRTLTYGSYGATGAANAMAGDGDLKSVLTNTVAGIAFPGVLKVAGKGVGYGVNKLRPNIDPKVPGIEPDPPTPPKPPARPVPVQEPIAPQVQAPVAPKTPGQPANNLDLQAAMDRYKNPNAVEPPKITPEAKRVQDVNSLSNEEFSSQLQKDLGISKNKADQLVKNNNKPALHTNLYGSKDKIVNANSPDAYATTVMNQANKRGQAALAQGAPPKPPVKNGGVAPEAPVPPKTQPKPTPTEPTTNLGKMGEDFYGARQGNHKIKYPQLVHLGEEIGKAAKKEYEAIGSKYEDVMLKIHKGVEKKVKTLEQAGLTPAEARIRRLEIAEMNYVRRRASLGKKEIGGGDFGEMYVPNVRKGQYKNGNLFDEFRATKPGNENVRQNKIPIAERDLSPDVTAEYIPRYADTKLYREERIAKQFAENNPDAPEKVVTKAASDWINLTNRVNGLKTKIGLMGLGRRKTLFEGKHVDTAGEASQIGRDLGKKQIQVDETPSGLTNGDRVNSVEVKPGETIGDHTGLNQWRDAESFANSQFANTKGDRTKLAQQVHERLSTVYDLPADTVKYWADSVARIAPGVPDNVVKGTVANIYKNLAKQQGLTNSQTLNITNKTLRKDVSDLLNQMLREGTMERELSDKIVSKALWTTNAIFRKLNVSSSLNELSDLSGIVSIYGRNTVGTPNFKLVSKYGLGDLDPALAPYIKATEEGMSVKKVLGMIDDKTNLYKYVETYKAAVMAASAEKHYAGLSGDALTKRLLKDYRDMVLPVDAFTKTFLDSAPLYTQYMSWGARNLQKEGRLMTGKLDGGVLANKTTGQRIARNLYANMPAKTVFWLASNGLKGTPVLVAFGINDFTGLTNQDYSGIQEQDKSNFDKYVAPHAGSSTTLGIAANVYQSLEKEKMKNDPKYKEPGEYNPYKNNDVKGQTIGLGTPQAYKNIYGVPTTKNHGAYDLQKRGYSENKEGRVQYEAPTDKFNQVKSYVLGKGNTTNARKYSGRENIVDRIKAGQNPVVGVKNMAAEQLGIKDTNYNRPLTKDYSTAYKSVDKSLKTATLDGGRKYNSELDNLKKNDPTNYNRYIASMDGNHVSPEFWRQITGGGATNNADLKIFGTMRERKKQLKADMDKTGMNKNGKYNYDPIYDLNDQQARQVLQQKSTMTGEDLALRNILYKEAWYKDFQAKSQEFYKNKPADDKIFKETPRVKEWNKYNTEYNDLSGVTGDREAKEYPLVHQLKQYEYGSQESKDFLKNNYDAWKAQRDAVDSKKLELINKMRKIEGGQPMSLEAYQQATNVKDTSGNDKNSGYGRGDFIPKLEFMSLQKTKIAAPKGVKVKAPTYKGTKGGVKKASIAKIRSNVNSKKLG